MGPPRLIGAKGGSVTRVRCGRSTRVLGAPSAQKDAAFHRVHGRALVALVSSVVFIALLVWFGARLYCGAARRTGGRVSLREAYRAG